MTFDNWMNMLSTIGTIASTTITLMVYFKVKKYIGNKKSDKLIENTPDIPEIIKEDLLYSNEVAKNILISMDSLCTKYNMNKFALNAPYGYGKSYINNCILKEINEKQYHVKNVISFKAWEKNEFYTPIHMMIMEIIKLSENKQLLSEDNINALKHIIQFEVNKGEVSYETYINIPNFIKQAINNLRLDTNNKLVILIDELDRAHPSDVVEFLEIVNQYTSQNKNIIILYSFDKDKLKKLIIKELGIVTDESYMKKFIDFTFEIFDRSREYERQLLINKENARNSWFKDFDGELSLRDVDHYVNIHNALSEKFNTIICEIAMKILVIKDVIHQQITDKRNKVLLDFIEECIGANLFEIVNIKNQNLDEIVYVECLYGLKKHQIFFKNFYTLISIATDQKYTTPFLVIDFTKLLPNSSYWSSLDENNNYTLVNYENIYHNYNRLIFSQQYSPLSYNDLIKFFDFLFYLEIVLNIDSNSIKLVEVETPKIYDKLFSYLEHEKSFEDFFNKSILNTKREYDFKKIYKDKCEKMTNIKCDKLKKFCSFIKWTS